MFNPFSLMGYGAVVAVHLYGAWETTVHEAMGKPQAVGLRKCGEPVPGYEHQTPEAQKVREQAEV